MTLEELEAIIAALAPVVKEAIQQEVAPLRAENAALRRELEEAKAAWALVSPGLSEDEMAALFAQMGVLAAEAGTNGIRAAFEAIPAPKDGVDGNDADPMALEALEGRMEALVAERETAIHDAFQAGIRSAIQELSAEIGKRVTLDSVAELVAADVASLPRPQDGKDADPEMVRAMVAEAVAALPAPKAGQDGNDGKDGVGLAAALIDRDGDLVVTLTDGRAVGLGPVVGRDGTDGKDGSPGAPGFSLDDFDVERTGDRGVVLKFGQGDRLESYELEFPVVVYRGVFREGDAYAAGDMVTFGGSLWHCNAVSAEKPGEGSSAWTLAAKRGRDGKDGNPGVKGDKGDAGSPGRDLTQVGFDGGKH